MASLVSYGACQTACNAGVVVCYSAAGLIFGAATGGAALPPAAIACNTAQGSCMQPVPQNFWSREALKLLRQGDGWVQ